MRIHVKTDRFTLKIPFPTNLIFGRGTVRLALWAMKKNGNDSLASIPPESLELLFREFRRIKRKHGRWTLVEVRSSGGEEVIITL